jgi:tRNA(Ile)-lysidine synthase
MPAADLLARFHAHLTSTGLFDPPGRVLVAVSGGPDSLGLLHLLHAVRGAAQLDLAVGHVDHGIHDRSADWAALVGRAADRLGLPLHLERLALGSGASETAARAARYAALRRMQHVIDAPYLATAHHASDQAETVLYRFLQGSGTAGLAGVPARGPHGLRRPLLPFTREELRGWLAISVPDLVPVDDPANADSRHDRVWVRGTLLPLLRARWPDVDGALARGARHAAAERVAWETLARTDPTLGLTHRDGVTEVEREPFRRYDNVLSDAVLRAVCRLAGCRPQHRRIDALREFVRQAPSGRRLDLGQGWTAETVFDRLRLLAPAPAAIARAAPDHAAWGGGESGEASWEGWGITWRREPASPVERRSWTTWVRGEGGEVRGAEPGDVLCPLAGVGRRPVRRLLMEARVPRSERAGYPVVVQRGRVLWIPGVCRGTEAVPAPGEPAVRLDVRRIGRS